MLGWRVGRRTLRLLVSWLGLLAPAFAPAVAPAVVSAPPHLLGALAYQTTAHDAWSAGASADLTGYDLLGGVARRADFMSFADFVSFASQGLPREDATASATLRQMEDATGEALLGAIYADYSAAIHTYAYRLLGNREDADDVTQEVFIRAHAHLAQLRDQARLRPWLYRIATNLCMDQLRKRSRIRRILGMETSLTPDDNEENGPPREIAQPGAATVLDSVAERDHIARALKRMPTKYATCLLLHSQQGLSYREIAAALGLTPGAAAVRLSRARDLFGKHYEELREEGAR